MSFILAYEVAIINNIFIMLYLQELRTLLARTQILLLPSIPRRCSVAARRSFSSLRKLEEHKNESFVSISKPLSRLDCYSPKLWTHNQAKKVVSFILPDVGEGINEVVIRNWLVKLGDHVKDFDSLCDVESDKAALPIISCYEGVISKIYYEVGEMAKVGEPLVDIEVTAALENGKVEEAKPQEATKTVDEARIITKSQPLPVSSIIPMLPSVRRMAKENGINLSLIKPSGKHGRVLKEDLIAYLESVQNEASEKVINLNRTEQLETVVPLGRIQRVMFKVMTQSVKVPHFNYADDFDLTNLTQAVKRLKERDVKIGIFPFIIKMVSKALLEFPQLNASLDDGGQNLVQKRYHNIGIAIDTQEGLIVPNIKNVEKLTVMEIMSELQRLRQAGYESKLGPNDLRRGTMTLSNIGAIGGVFGVPVLVTPEILIGAIGKTRQLPRFDNSGNVVPRHIMQLCWSADHRVVDGATLSRFSNLLKLLLEEPGLALTKMR